MSSDWTLERQRRRAEQERAFGEKIAAANLTGPFRAGVVLADPGWQWEVWSEKGRCKSPKYRTESLEAIKRYPLRAAKDCVLFLWRTVPLLEAGVEIARAWASRRSPR
jgi:hypothetical protein